MPKASGPRAPTNAVKKKAKKKPGEASALLATVPGDASDDPAPGGARTSLGAGIAKPVSARIDWASLIRRVYLEDVIACPCGGRRRVVADITDRSVVVAILEHLGLPAEPPPIARARSPSSLAA